MKNLNIIIREANTNDIHALACLMTELGYPTNDNEMATRFQNISPHPDYKTVLALVDEQVVGMAGLSKHFFFEKNGPYIRIVALVVSKEYRNQGVGKIFLQEAEKFARESGAKAIILNSGNREERKAAHKFYERNGYECKSLGFVKNI